MRIYFISGLGADERVFRYLTLPQTEKIFVKWPPIGRGETIQSYSKKLLQQIKTDKPLILLGVSFGGIIAQEIAKLVPCLKVIIISSIKSARELGWQSILVKNIRLYRLFSPKALKAINTLAADYFFSVKTKGESLLLRQIVRETQEEFLQWAITQIMLWDNTSLDENLIHIHGTVDRIFPYSSIKNGIPIKAGGHFMIVNRADEISSIILDTLKTLKVNPGIA